MKPNRFHFGNRIAILVIGLSLTLPGCGPSEEKPAEQAEPIDPRFATPQALLELFNSYNTQLPPDHRSLVALYHIENDFQRKKFEVIRRSTASASYDLEIAMYRRFGEGRMPKSRLKVRPCTRATLTKFTDRRAEGTYRDWLGEERPLHLIEIGGRWWVSGYTLEYESSAANRDMIEAISDMLLKSGPSEDEYLRPIIAEVNAGKYATADEAREAAKDMLFNHLDEKYGR
jgi:hypothetical protein